MYLFQVIFFSPNHIFALKNLRKDIFKTIFMLISANKKIFLKNQILFNLF